LRFEVETGCWVKLVVVGSEGNAELFGTELIREKPYYFHSGQGFGVFTWAGCKVRLTGRTEAAYISKETPMICYLNVSMAIETLRQEYEKENENNKSTEDYVEKLGPRVLICGAQDVGKSTLARILLNYGVRLGRRPIYIDLAVDSPAFGIPGSVGALTIERPADPVEGFDTKNPIIYHFGHTLPNGNLLLYETLVKRLQDIFNTKCLYNSKAHASGCVINTCGWIRSKGYEVLLQIAQAFEADVVLCLGIVPNYSESFSSVYISIET
jgi:polyribonucleotide 5'-hydroxyl-kinase